MEPKKVIEEIRKIRFGIGLDTSGLSNDVVKSFEDKKKILEDASGIAEEIHTRKPHFILELIQNAEDNNYKPGIEPSLKFILNSNCLIIQNNEEGFNKKNASALCEIGGSTKKNNKSLGYIGEKGIGFKSVFMISNKVQIYSNGFQFGFNYDKNNSITMIVPEWIDEVPSFVDPKQTNIVLYLNPEATKKIQSYFNEIQPSLLLFLKKIETIEILRSENGKSSTKITKTHKKNGVVKITYGERENYWKVVRKLFNVPNGINKERRNEVKKTEIILAFPLNKDRFPDASSEQSIFAFLPVKKGGFKFIVQADFILLVTREDIIKDNMWNKWLRDSITSVIVDAVNEFKDDENLKYNFYNYFDFEDVKDDFFIVLVKNIYKIMAESESILSESGNWKKPPEILMGDEEIKKIIPNENLQRFLGKEYLSGRVQAKKTVLYRLGVKDFSIDDLFKCLENTEWIEKQSEEWFAGLFKYLSKKKLSDEQLKQLKDLKVIRLENGKLVSINEGIFIPLNKNAEYGFESEIRMIKRGIIDAISKYDKEEKENVLKFLRELGLRQANPSGIIEDHILKVYEDKSETWKKKDSKILMGYIKYIKDNMKKIEESKNGKKLFERIKKSIRVRTDKNNKEFELYDRPENLYISKIYGNKNNLEELFEGINVGFIHPCYLENIEQVDSKIDNLKNRLKNKSNIEKEIKELEIRIKNKETEVESWRNFFSKLGAWETLIVKIDPDTEYYEGPRYAKNKVTEKHLYLKDKKNSVWKDEDWMHSERSNSYSVYNNYNDYYVYNDYISPDLDKVLERIKNNTVPEKQVELSKRLIILLDKYWDKTYKDRIKAEYYYRCYGQFGWSCSETKSTFYLKLLKNSWLPTNKNTLARPSEVFLDKPEIRSVLGDTVPYLTVNIENKDLLEKLGVNTKANVESVLNCLKAIVKRGSEDKDKFKKIYKFLDEHFEEGSAEIKETFEKYSMIFVPNSLRKYYRSKEVIWENVGSIFGKNTVYLEKYYPQIKWFFVEKLNIHEKPNPKGYSDVLCSMSERGTVSDEDKKVIIKIYEELNRNLNPNRVENPISNEDWWEDFVKKAIFFTDKDKFWRNDKDIFINDDDELYNLFKNNGRISFLWLPKGYHPDKIRFFIKACKLRYLSKSIVSKPLLEETIPSKNEKLTKEIRNVMPYILRYLYWKENSTYEKLKKDGDLEKIVGVKAYIVDNLKVEYSININEWSKISKSAGKNCTLYNNNLYITKDNTNMNLIAIELSKIFGEIKGLDDFSMNIMNNPSQAEDIMKAKNIRTIPDAEDSILKKITTRIENNEKLGNREEKITDGLPKEAELQDETKIPTQLPETAKPREVSGTTSSHPKGKYTYERVENNLDKAGEQNDWAPEVFPEEAPINIEEFSPKEQKTTEKHSMEVEPNKEYSKSSSPARSSTTASTSATETSEYNKKEVGQWGEAYAFKCIKDELIKKYPSAFIVDIDQEFELREKDNRMIARVLWLNKEKESRKHYDIKIIENGEETFVEVKSTKDRGKSQILVSKEEWKFMREQMDRCYIYRVYGAKTKEVKLKKFHNPVRLWEEGYIDASPVAIEL